MKKKDDWSDFLHLCLSSKNKEDLSSLFDLLMTFEERDMLASRVAIIKHLLEEKITQRTIAKKLRVSIAQITRGSNELKHFSQQFKKRLLSQLKKDTI